MDGAGSPVMADAPPTTDEPTCRFLTFGCKINQYDTQAIRESVLDLGYREVDSGGADVIVVNSCTVTDRAGDKGVGAVRRLARDFPSSRILVTGCLSPEDRARCEEVGIAFVLGNEEKDQIPALLEGAAVRPVGPRPSDRRRSRAIFGLRASRFEGRTRAFIKVHDGCDEFCSYCIIPFVRGKSKSRSLEDVLDEARRLARSGHRELVITGIHLRRYGADLGISGGIAALMSALRGIEGVERIRLSSIGEKTFTDEFLDFVASDEAYCRFFHIPLQSGSDAVLERMRREYTVAEYLDTVARIRDRLPTAVITTDLMIGFPGETDEEFATSLDTCRRAAFAFLHVFPYSVRTGTRAARLPDHVSGAVRKHRVEEARVLDSELRRAEVARWVGRDVRVLVERGASGWGVGLSREGHHVRFSTPTPLPRGTESSVRVEGAAPAGHYRETGPVTLRGTSFPKVSLGGA
ncbi:MAG: tRNA (N(6)-L-threonylcarbamoyladenosine(37)-C(2))-methylthiotransferase MtaB [Planctomycetes bacterium]|nr:tRNA (N(6)-L-threonylcarbamoyladenosine(37)-C(2))-methylthiotransferase MtaB [Planctomycetota bacterium]